MKHSLARTLFYGSGAGILLFLSINNTGGWILLYLPLFVLLGSAFLVTEFLLRAKSATPDSKVRTQEKLAAFTSLTLTGAAVAVVVFLSTANWEAGASSEYISSGLATTMFCGCPFGLFYIISLLWTLTAFTRPRSGTRGQVSGEASNVDSPSDAPPEIPKTGNYGLRVLTMAGTVILGCITMVSAYLLIEVILSFFTGASVWTGLSWKDVATTLFMTAVIGAGLFGIVKLVQALRK